MLFTKLAILGIGSAGLVSGISVYYFCVNRSAEGASEGAERLKEKKEGTKKGNEQEFEKGKENLKSMAEHIEDMNSWIVQKTIRHCVNSKEEEESDIVNNNCQKEVRELLEMTKREKEEREKASVRGNLTSCSQKKKPGKMHVGMVRLFVQKCREDLEKARERRGLEGLDVKEENFAFGFDLS